MSSIVSISIFIFVLFCITFLIFLTSFIISLARKFQNKHKAYEKSTDDLNQQHEQNMLQSYTEVQEQTLEDIARELHDNIGQKLSLANFCLNSMNIADIEKTSQQIGDLKIIVNDSIADLSNLNKSISNQILYSNGLIYALNREMILMKNIGNFETNFEVKGQSSFMSQASELMIFRVIQELLNNIIKHSKAKKVTMKIEYENGECNILLFDNGIGIDTSHIISDGLGLQNIQKRLSMLKATYTSIPKPGEGTTIHIKIPLNDKP